MTRPRTLLWSLTGLALVVLLVAVWFFVAGGPWPFGSAKIYEAEVRGESNVTLFVGGCEGSPHVESVEESNEHVRVSVSATRYFQGAGDCLEVVELELERPLGDRSIVDMTTGQTVDEVTRVD